jgi:hypothetical protein
LESTDHRPQGREHPHVSGGIASDQVQVVPGKFGRPFDAAHVLGCSSEQALRLFRGRPVTPGEAEAIATKVWRWRGHLHDPDSYWITTRETARILDLTPPQVKRLLDRGRLPYVRDISRVRLMRRAQILAIAATRT